LWGVRENIFTLGNEGVGPDKPKDYVTTRMDETRRSKNQGKKDHWGRGEVINCPTP